MPTLKYLDEAFDCTTAIKGDDYIHLLDDNGVMVAAFDAITDFSGFTLENGSYVSPTADHSCRVAVIRDDGTIGVGGHTCEDIGNAVPKTRKVNGKPLSADITITGKDIADIYSKEAVLTDETKTKYGLGADAVPDDAFSVLSRFQSGLGHEYVWEKVGYEYTPLWGSAISQASLSNSISHSITVSVTFYNDVVYESGAWVLANEYKTYSGITNGNIQTVLSTTVLQNIGVKYFADINGKIYKTVPGTSWAGSSSGASQWNAYIGSVCAFTGTNTETASYGYVNSPYADTYPPAVSDGYTYLGPWTVGGGKIATGSYKGTDKYGSSNRCSLTFDFVPKLVIVQTYGAGNDGYSLVMVANSTTGNSQMSGGGVTVSGWGTNTINWYSSSSQYAQFNASGSTNVYIAIG